MANLRGDFIWYELLTTDVAAAEAFYAAVLGWQGRDAGMPTPYRIQGTGAADVAGLMALPDGDAASGMRPGWLGYIAVEDVDAAVAATEAAGGRTLMPPMEVEGVGRFALLADPQGIPFYAMRGAAEAMASTAFDPEKPGHCRWNELTTPDQPAAIAFYGRQFGWTPAGAMPMGELGEYAFIAKNGVTIGAVMPLPPQAAPGWKFYFGVADIDAAIAAVGQAAGTVQFGPQEVPGGMFIILGADPQGASFALVGPRTG